jgi:hypothetical protein
MTLHNSLSILITSLLLCGNAFAKPGNDEAPPTVDVNVVNTPDVVVVNTPDVVVVNTPDVVVANTPLEPVPTVLGGEPFQVTVSNDNWDGANYRNVIHDIPDDQMLIVQTVSVAARVEIGQEVRATITTQGQGVGLVIHWIPLTRQGTFNGLDLYVGTMSLTSYASGISSVFLSVARNSTTGNGGIVQFSVSGYIVDIP